MRSALGRQVAATLGIGDRYVFEYCGRRIEVTVSHVTDNVDGSLNVRIQRSDPHWGERCWPSGVVFVTYRAPRCRHGLQWDECEPCGDEWPTAIEDAYFGDACPGAL
ncbi:hypothetical protein EES39_38430 [Streptomyces sp. ADI92-24]|nr:hypothetical protein EES39_38430 [Streptomyces sp. ADI92-24]